jgi:transposase
MHVDYAGKTLSIIDEDAGGVKEAPFFVAILVASQYTYAETLMIQQKENFVTSVDNAIRFLEANQRQLFLII